jgi:hypothetical protein
MLLTGTVRRWIAVVGTALTITGVVTLAISAHVSGHGWQSLDWVALVISLG